ncbi:MAG: TonB-dependent receptor domain-containing protein [Flavobacteriales bacterium]
MSERKHVLATLAFVWWGFGVESASGQAAQLSMANQEVPSSEDTLKAVGFGLQQLEIAEVVSSPDPAAGQMLQQVERLEVTALDLQPAISRLAALDMLPAVNMHMSGGGMIRPIIHGLSGLRVRTQFHEALVENQAWGNRNGIFVAEEGIERVEVIRGPGTLALASGATGGVIRFVPLAPPADPGRHTRFSLAGHSNTEGFQASAMTRKRSETAYHAFVGGLNRFDALKTPDGQAVEGTAYGQFYAQGRYGYIRDWGRIEGAYTSTYNTSGILGQEGISQSGDHLITTKAFIPSGSWTWQPGFSYQLNHRIETNPGVLLVDPPAQDTVFDQSLRTSRFQFRGDREASTIGIQWAWGFQSAVLENTGELDAPENQLIPDALALENGVFIMPGWQHQNLSVEGIVRGDFHRLSLAETQEFEGAENRSFAFVSAGLGIQWQGADHFQWGLQAARNGRAPSMGELWSQGLNAGSAREEWGDVNLRTEVSHALETQWIWTEDTWSAELGAHWTNIQDFVHWQPQGLGLSGLESFKRHQADASICGVDFSSGWASSSGWTSELSGSWIQGRLADKSAIPLLPPSNVRLATGWARKDWRAQMVVTHSQEATLIHLSTAGQLGTHLGWSLAVNNLLNHEYTTVLSDLRNLNMPEAGRNIRLRLTWEWKNSK